MMTIKPGYRTTRDLIRMTSHPKGSPDSLEYDFSIQRPAVWNNEKKSLLIYSVLLGDPVPPLFIAWYDNCYSVPHLLIDGKQRVTTAVSFVTGEGRKAMKLWKGTPPVTIPKYEKDENGNTIESREIIEIAGKTFKQLPEEAQRLILDYQWDTRMISGYTQEDLARIMYNLNNGQAATATQKAIMKLGIKLGDMIQKVTESQLFEEDFEFTAKEIKSGEAHKCVLYSLIQWSGQDYEDFTYGKLTGTTLNNLINKYSQNWSKIHIQGIQNIFDTLHEMLPDNPDLYKPFMRSSHLPVITMNVDKYLEMLENEEITEKQYRTFLELWFTNGVNSKEFKSLTVEDGKNISTKSNIETRIDLMDTALDNFLATGDLGLTYVTEKSETDFANTAATEITKPETIPECVKKIKTIFKVDDLTAMRCVLNTTQDIFCYDLNDSIEYSQVMTEPEVNETVSRTNIVTKILTDTGICCEELPSYYELYRLSLIDGISTEQFIKWIKHWTDNPFEEYINHLENYDGTSAAQTVLTNYLHNNLLKYVSREENANERHTA